MIAMHDKTPIIELMYDIFEIRTTQGSRGFRFAGASRSGDTRRGPRPGRRSGWGRTRRVGSGRKSIRERGVRYSPAPEWTPPYASLHGRRMAVLEEQGRRSTEIRLERWDLAGGK